MNGRLQQEKINVGDICVVPAYTRHWFQSDGEQELILLSFDADFLKGIAYECTQNNSLELLPHFIKSDPLIYHIALSLKTALENNPTRSKFYAESLITALAAHLIQSYTAQASSSF